MNYFMTNAQPGFNQVVALDDGTFHRIPIIAWRMSIDGEGAIVSVEYITADMQHPAPSVAVEYPTGTVETEEKPAKLYQSFAAFLASRRAHTAMSPREAVAFLQLIKGETASRDYGPGLNKVIDLLNDL